MIIKNTDIKDIRQLLIIYGGLPILQVDLEELEDSSEDRNNMLAGFVSAIESFSSSYDLSNDEAKIVGFGSSNIIIDKAEHGIVGALITEKTADNKVEILGKKLASIINLFNSKYIDLLKTSTSIDETIFNEFIPYIIGILVDSKISQNNIPKPTNVSDYPELMSGDCWRVYMQIDGVRNIKQICESLGSYEKHVPLFLFLESLGVIKLS
ncbi:MAG: hypothetical protein HeimC3_44010 [Candidatus Heimdallarchaeota archaeon LC_3]|nr:MAG: hypothetical protein HeimC3_44010 [Candidatus Heimdallarchaeota archaeon LC_3]